MSGLSERETSYVAELTPNWVRLLIDGKEVMKQDRNQLDQTGTVRPLQQPFRLILNLALGGWAKKLDLNALPASFTIKSVRVWELKGDANE